MLMRANDDAQLRKTFNETYEANGLNIVTHALMNQLILTLLKMHDAVDPGNDRTAKRASLPHIGHLLSDPAVASALAEEARQWHPSLNRGEEDAQLVRKRLARIRRRIGSVQSCARQRWLKTLLGIRYANLAHLLFGMTLAERDTFGQIEYLVRATTPHKNE